MAKGNMGNLAQHFVALKVIGKIVADWDNPSVPIEYIDCYSMGVWEELEQSQTPQRHQFLNRCSNFMNIGADPVAAVFVQAWNAKYGRRLPLSVVDREYPNTAYLLRTAFPDQLFKMRLHDVIEGNFQLLTHLARSVGPEHIQIDKDWTQSRLIHNSPAPVDCPVVVMLDPYRIVRNDHERANDAGYLNPRLIEYLIGPSALAIHPHLRANRTSPCVIILCSYSEQNPEIPSGVVAEVFREGGWSVERLVAGPFPDVGNVKSHVFWVASFGYSVPILGLLIQDSWNQWLNLTGGPL